MSGELLGRRLLRLDAFYCAAAGLIALLLFERLAELLGTPRAVPIAAGTATLAWALVVRLLAANAAWRPRVTIVAVANVAAATAIAVLAVLAPATAARVLLAAVAVEVAAFAGGQIVALRR
jgi:hypothetical protein